MNYSVKLCGKICDEFDSVAKLIIETAKEADYLVSTHADRLVSPVSNFILTINMKGSSKDSYKNIVLDFEQVYSGSVENTVVVDPLNCNVAQKANRAHYWAIAGELFRVVNDLSPAYITSFLIENKKNKELQLFKEHVIKPSRVLNQD